MDLGFVGQLNEAARFCGQWNSKAPLDYYAIETMFN
jgi:hypothetical protein